MRENLHPALALDVQTKKTQSERAFRVRFEKFFIRGGGDECWNWCGARGNKKYGIIRVKGKTQFAHRMAWVLTFGEIAEGFVICHKCDNPLCVNPGHLFIGTQKDNMQDAAKKKRLKGRPKKV